MQPGTSIITAFEHQFSAYLAKELSNETALNDAMKYSLLNGGKRIRPLFVMESSQLISLNQVVSFHCAVALEMVHAFSLVHDDLPAMDNDDFRRGLPTTHKKFGEAQALLAGDALLNFANRTFLKCAPGTIPESFLRAYDFFTQSIHEMILGQSDELTLKDPNLEQLIRIQSLKTGALFRASLLCPLLLAGLTEKDELFLQCDAYAKAFGFAFQIADDIEDDEQDRAQGAKNILSLMGRESAIAMALQKLSNNPVASQFSATPLLISKLK